MKDVLLKFSRLMIGLFLYAFGIVISINAQEGLAPWHVFHQGLSFQMNITLGNAIQIVGIAIIILDFILGEKIGWGTITNVIFIGLFIDLITDSRLVPISENTTLSFLMIFIGMFTTSQGAYFYLSTQLGAGPRDGLMIALTKRANKPMGLIKSSIEITVLMAGYLLGGPVGWGTLIMSLMMGFLLHTTFRMFKFDVKNVKHKYIDQDFALLIQKLNKVNKITILKREGSH